MDELSAVWIKTTLGAVYRFPDLLTMNLPDLTTQLDQVETLVLRNVSEATMTIPKRIIAEVGVVGESTPLWRVPSAG